VPAPTPNPIPNRTSTIGPIPKLFGESSTSQENATVGTYDKSTAATHSAPASEAFTPLSLQSIQDNWQEWVAGLNGAVSRFLSLQLQKTVIHQYQDDVLELRVESEFGVKMLNEHEASLRDWLKEQLGRKPKLHVTVDPSLVAPASSRDPFEAFKEIQQKDPIVAELVKRFGAELKQ